MFLVYIFMFFSLVLCESDENELGYGLEIGNSVDIFANYGDLSQVTQVVSAEYSDDEPLEIFREKNIKVFANATVQELGGDTLPSLSIQLCENIDELLATYFQRFTIEGTNQPWKAFMGDWIIDEIMRTFGIEHNYMADNCCYALVKLSLTHRTVKLGDLKYVTLKSQVRRQISSLNISNPMQVRRFMQQYGTHYIDSFSTGNFIYQVFQYKRHGYNLLRKYLTSGKQVNQVNLRYHFSSYFLKQVGDIRVASGNKTVENWARKRLRNPQYLFSRPSLLRLQSNTILATQLKHLLDNAALMSLNLKTLQPLFKDRYKAERFKEIVLNDLLLWEINA